MSAVQRIVGTEEYIDDALGSFRELAILLVLHDPRVGWFRIQFTWFAAADKDYGCYDAQL